MAKNQYTLGYSDGYKAGYEKKRYEEQSDVVMHDLEYIYGMLVLNLLKENWDADRIGDFLVALQASWVEEANAEEKIRARGEVPESVPEKVLRLTGIDLIQHIEGDGKDNPLI